MKLREHVAILKSIVGDGFTDGFIAALLQQARAYIVNTQKDLRDLSSSIVLEFEALDSEDCFGDFPCRKMRSKYQLPAFLDGTLMIQSFEESNLPYISPIKNKYIAYSNLPTINQVGWYILNGYIYLVNTSKITTLIAKAVFTDLKELNEYNKQVCSNEAACLFYLDEEFKINTNHHLLMYDYAKKLIGRIEKETELRN